MVLVIRHSPPVWGSFFKHLYFQKKLSQLVSQSWPLWIFIMPWCIMVLVICHSPPVWGSFFKHLYFQKKLSQLVSQSWPLWIFIMPWKHSNPQFSFFLWVSFVPIVTRACWVIMTQKGTSCIALVNRHMPYFTTVTRNLFSLALL